LVRWYFEGGKPERLKDIFDKLKSTELLNLPEWKKRKLGTGTGIYVLYKKEGNERIVYYVGKTRRDLPTRVEEHLKDSHKGKWEEFSLYGTDKRTAKALETLAIKIADPELNKRGKKAHFSGAVNLKRVMRDYYKGEARKY